MKIKTNENGQVDFTLKSGKDKVKNVMLASEAIDLIHKGDVKKNGKNLIVDDKFIFEIEDDPEMSDMPDYQVKEEVKEEPKKEVKEEPKEEVEEAVEEPTEEPTEEKPARKIVRRKNA